jgi:Ca2+-binding RTX toxin-like protein
MAGAQKVGAEFRINTTTRGPQIYSDVTALANGGFAVAFTSQSIKADNTLGANDVLGRIYGADYQPDTSDFFIATQPQASQVFDERVALAVRGAGFVAVWNAPFGANSSSIVAETFNGSGGGGGEFKVNDGSNQFHFPDVATSTTGNYLVVWDDAGQGGSDNNGFGILAKVNGAGPLITINTTTAGHQTAAQIAALQGGSGNYLVTWRSLNTVNQHVDIKAQIVSAAGAKVGGEITVAGNVYSGESTVAAGLQGGRFAIAYFDRYNIMGKVYDAGGAVLTPSFKISDGDTYYAPAIAGLSNGLIAVAYERFNDFQSMYLKTFAPDGTQIGNTLTFDGNGGVQAGSNYAGQPSIAALLNGKFVITWTDTTNAFDPIGTEFPGAIVGQIYSSSTLAFVHGTNAANAFNGATQSGFFLGYGGTDTVTYAGASAGVSANLTTHNAAGGAAGDGFGNSIENLTGSKFADNLIGNASANILDGGLGNDVLTGGAGLDSLRGGGGNDTYVLESGGDSVIDTAGIDTATSTVSRSIAGYTTIENLVLVNVAAALAGTGNNLANTISGNNFNNTLNGANGNDRLNGGLGDDNLIGGTGNDVLNGSTGNDTLTGGVGIDTLTGGANNDFFVFNAPLNATNRDVVVDFSGPLDTFRLENGVMPQLGAPGALDPGRFFAGPAAHDADDRIVYNKTTGALFYDSNGNAAGGVTHLATLSNKAALTAADFVVI